MRKIFLISILVLLSVSVFSQFNLSGKITDSISGDSLSGAIIRLENSKIATASDLQGNYILKLLNPGVYKITVSYIGYESSSKEITLQSNKKLNFCLNPSSIRMNEILVSATRVPNKAPASMKIISNRDIGELNTGQDLPYILESAPSTVTTSDGGTGIGYTGLRIRGSDMTRINVTVNGIPFNDPESQEVYWVDIPDIASSIDNIQIQRGVGTSTNGAASFGASINIQTIPSGDKAYGEIDNFFGSYNSRRHSLKFGSGLIQGKWSIDGRVSKIKSDGYIDRASSDLNSMFLTGTLHAKKSIFRINIFTGKERTYQAWDGVPSEILDTNRTFNVNGLYYDANGKMQFYRNEVDDYSQSHYHLMYSYSTNKSTSINTAFHYTHGEGYYEQFVQGEDYTNYQLSTMDTTVSSTDLITRKWLKNDFYGLTYSLNHTTNLFDCILGGAWNHYEGAHFGKINWTQNAFQQNTWDYEWYRNKGIKKDFNFFAKLRYQVLKKLSLYADVQYRSINYSLSGPDENYRLLDQTHNFNFLNPKTGIYFDINKHQNLQLSFAIANREPNRSNYQDADPGNMPKQERLTNIETSYNIVYKSVSGSICAYYMDYKDQLVLTGEINAVGAPIMTNVPQSYRAGIELILGLALTGNLKWDGSLTLSRNKIKSFTEFVDDWDNGGQISRKLGETDLNFSPSIIGSNTLSWTPVKRLVASWTAKYVGSQFIDNTSSSSRKLDAYLVNNVRASYTLSSSMFSNIRIYFQVNNVFSENYESNAWIYRYYYENKESKMDGYFPQAPINIMAGITLSL